MLTVVPWTEIRDATRDALRGLPGVQYRWTGRDDRAYWWLLRGLWDDRRPFTIVEHDVVPMPGTVRGLWACPEDWCAVPYPVGDILATGLGCTKFETAVMERHPDLLRSVPDRARHWNGLDAAVIGELNRRGERVHQHEPTAFHLHREAIRMSGDNIIRLRWVGDGSRYLHEDASIGLPPTPPADFETADRRHADIAVATGLYEEVGTGDTVGRRGKRPAPEPDAPATEPEAEAAEA